MNIALFWVVAHRGIYYNAFRNEEWSLAIPDDLNHIAAGQRRTFPEMELIC
jgi:hypothetical protein